MAQKTKRAAADDESASTEQFEIKFPLPDCDPSLCRDEYIQKFLDQEEKRISMLKPRLSVTKGSFSDDGFGLTEHESKLLANIVQRWWTQTNYSRHLSTRSTQQQELRHSQLMELNLQCQKASIEFMSVRLIRQLRIFSNPWPGKLDDIPYRLFTWSLDNFMSRLDMNQIYLDVIHRDRTTEELDCLKFRTDLHEIMVLIYEIREDFSQNLDFCESSMQMLRDAKYHLDGPWIQGLVDNSQLRDKLKASIQLTKSSSVNIKNTRLTEVIDQIEDVSALDPIEVRYRLNWLSSCADQRLMLLNGREEELAKQLKDLETINMQNLLVRNHMEHIYALEVDGMREKLNEWQSRYDNDLENSEVECTVARLALQKVKDDLKFYQEQEQMYKRRIAEERELMATEQKIQREKQPTVDVQATVTALEAVYKPKEPTKKRKKSAKF